MEILSEEIVIERLVRWAQGCEAIRAMLLYSSRANPQAAMDDFSDYDILLAVDDIHPFHEDPSWLGDLGPVLVVFRNPIGVEYGFECFGFITHYREGFKVDFGFYPAEYLRWAARQPHLPDDLDNGYRILLDKDGLTQGLLPPTYQAYLPLPPSAEQYLLVVEEFFNDALYVAKNLARDNLFNVKLSLDHIMKFGCLRKMLEWQAASLQGWSTHLGAYGKGLKKQVDTQIWAELERTYCGADPKENWEALFRTVILFRRVGRDVASRLGFGYPEEIDSEVWGRLEEIKSRTY